MPAFKGYHGFPATLCTSVNEEVIHGIPSARALATTSATRLDDLPDVPTMAEILPGAPDVTNWGAILAPAGTPEPVVNFLAQSIDKALAKPEVRKVYETHGYDVKVSSPRDTDAFVGREVEKFRVVVREAGILKSDVKYEEIIDMSFVESVRASL